MIPYEVIKDKESDLTNIRCGYCREIFKTIQLHEQHQCRKENNMNAMCLSCKEPYNAHTVENEDSILTDVEASKVKDKRNSPNKVGTAVYRCCMCIKEYQNLSHLVRHVKYHMATEGGDVIETVVEHSCSRCDKFFTTKQQLKRHTTAHDDMRPYECRECGKSFKTADGVKRHVYVHSDARPFSCRTCGKNFKAKHLMKKHEETHSDEKHYECSKCEKKFKARNSLRDHLLVHDGIRPHKCDQCSRAFYRRSHLATHKVVHSEEKPFACKVCSKCFGRREHLKVHERIHSGEKPFKCSQCERSFNQQAGLQAHRVSHSDERPYTCLTCKKTFKYPSQVRHHACKPDEIGPCMLSHAHMTALNSEPTSDGPGNGNEEGQKHEKASSSSAVSNVNISSNTEDTIIVIHIENTSNVTDETAMSVNAVASHEGDLEPGRNTDVLQAAVLETQKRSEEKHTDAGNIQTCSGNTLRKLNETFGTHRTGTFLNREGKFIDRAKSESTFATSLGDTLKRNVNMHCETHTVTRLNSDERQGDHDRSAVGQEGFTSPPVNIVERNISFAETCVPETHAGGQGRYVNTANASYTATQDNSTNQYNIALERTAFGVASGF